MQTRIDLECILSLRLEITFVKVKTTVCAYVSYSSFFPYRRLITLVAVVVHMFLLNPSHSRPVSLADIPNYIKIFKGECADGKEIRMYQGNGDNPGTAEERTLRCSEACRNKKTPLSGSWADFGFVANGFVVNPANGHCVCESSHSLTCKRGSTSSSYYRYDWKAPRL